MGVILWLLPRIQGLVICMILLISTWRTKYNIIPHTSISIRHTQRTTQNAHSSSDQCWNMHGRNIYCTSPMGILPVQ